MLTVNLIKERRKEQLRQRVIGETLVRVGVGLALLTLTYLAFGKFSVNRLAQEISQTDMRKIDYRAQADEVKRLRSLNASLEPRMDLVRKTSRRLDHWRYVYAQVARSIPDTVRLESLDFIKANDGGKSVQIMGRADNAHAISKALLALNTQPGLSDLDMGAVSMTVPHQATMNAKMQVRPLPEDMPPPPAAPPTTGSK